MVESEMFDMNICLVNQEYPDETDFGGIATYMHYLGNGLNKLGHNVFVVARSYKKDSYIQKDGIHVFRICEPDEVNYRIRVAEKVREIVDDFGLDIIESSDWAADLNEYYNRYKDICNVPVVVKLHTPYFIWKKINYVSNYVIDDVTREEWEKNVICNADGVFSCSDALKVLVAEEYGMNVDEIETIPNMIDIECQNYSKECLKNTIYYIGSIEQRKGVLVLAEAFKKIKLEVPDAKLVFIGRDTDRNDKRISTKEYINNILEGIEGYEFKGHVTNNLIENYIKEPRVLVYPSLFENFPYVVLEGMKNGKTIIGSNNGGMPEMIEENISGQLYTPPNSDELAEKIIRVLRDEELADYMARNAADRVGIFSSETIIPKQVEYYKGIIDKNNAR